MTNDPTGNRTLPRNRPTNAAADAEPKRRHTEPTLEEAIDDETGGLLHPSRDEKRTDRPAREDEE